MSLRRVQMLRWARALLRPLGPVYAAGVALEQRAALLPGRRPQSLPSPVISVGSVSAGGAGKTPMVLLLAGMLRRRGYAVRILTRGYGREGRAVEPVDPEGDAVRFGDEPLLLARRSGVPVMVGADRYRAGLLAEGLEEVGPGVAQDQTTKPGATVVHLLDDGFQHRRLRRDVDIVLLTRKDVEDVLLPAGDLREPLRALRRADVVVLREEEAEALRPVVESLPPLPATAGEDGTGRRSRAVWVVRRSLRLVPQVGPLGAKRVLVFCGIARPEGFLEMVRAAGVEAVATVVFPDHYRYRERGMERLLREAQAREADALVTTEKDAVKFTAAMRRRLEAVARLHVAELDLALLDERAAMEDLIGMVGGLDRRRGRRAVEL